MNFETFQMPKKLQGGFQNFETEHFNSEKSTEQQ